MGTFTNNGEQSLQLESSVSIKEGLDGRLPPSHLLDHFPDSSIFDENVLGWGDGQGYEDRLEQDVTHLRSMPLSWHHAVTKYFLLAIVSK